MRVGIFGTRGIPNAYGGFEEFAQHLSLYLVQRGHEVLVYNSSLHPYQESSWEGVEIVHCRDWEDKLGTAGQFVYDFNCLRDARKQNLDVLLQLGYTSSSIWAPFLPKKAVVITNMDGLEWKRSKFSKPVQRFLQWAERRAVESSDYLVADSMGIKSYLDSKFGVDSTFIAYGALISDGMSPALLSNLDVNAGDYDMLLARMEPENNIEMILRGHMESGSDTPLLVIGDNQSKYSTFLRKSFGDKGQIRFMGAIYDKDILNALRQHSRYYFHGHSVGGTNPSLLEAMACSAMVIAHDNPFNKGVLQGHGRYFDSSEALASLIRNGMALEAMTSIRMANRKTIEDYYTWPMINKAYEELMLNSLKR